MTDKEKLLKLRKLADAMYYAAQHLTTDASRLHKAMDEYHQFIINEYHKKEPTIPDIVDEHFYEMLEEEPVSEQNLSNVQRIGKNWKEEPVKDRFAFKAIPRLLDMIKPTDRAKSYVTKLADAFDSEGYYTDAKIVRNRLKIMNGEKVSMATMDEEPVSEEPEEFARANANKEYPPEHEMADDNWKQRAGYVKGFKAGAKWKEEQMIANTADAMIGVPYENKDGGYTHLIDVSRPLPVGNNKIAIIFKED